MLLEYSDLISIISLIISMINLFLYYKYIKKTTGPAIMHIIHNLPPYSGDEETVITVKNVGNSTTKIDGTWLTFSWNDELIYDLDYECPEESFYLFPNEEKTFHKRLPTPLQQGKFIIKITTEYDKWEKTDSYPITIS